MRFETRATQAAILKVQRASFAFAFDGGGGGGGGAGGSGRGGGAGCMTGFVVCSGASQLRADIKTETRK